MAGRPAKPIVNPPNRIREARELHGLTQDQVGQRVGKTGATVAKYETGETAISVYMLHRIARAIGVPAYSLIIDYDGPRHEQERTLLTLFRRLTPSDQARALAVLMALEQSEQQIRSAG